MFFIWTRATPDTNIKVVKDCAILMNGLFMTSEKHVDFFFRYLQLRDYFIKDTEAK